MIILASASPRREEILRLAGLTDFEIIPAQADEDLEAGTPPAEAVRAISRRKAEAVAGTAPPDGTVIGADTLVYIDGMILGKPRDKADAFAMLSRLSGRRHEVYTGVTVIRLDRVITEHEVTEVRFRALSAGEIDAYIETGEPMDKAGAYGIQGIGAVIIEGICGDFYNVMGLPLSRLYGMLKAVGIDLLGRNG